MVNSTLLSTIDRVCCPTAPSLCCSRTLSKTRNWWQRATESLVSPPSPWEIITQEGSLSRRKLVVNGIVNTVVVVTLVKQVILKNEYRTNACLL